MHIDIVSLLTNYKYLILVPLAAFEGPIVALAVGFLVHMGKLSFFPAYIIMLFGDIIPDSIYYYIGYSGLNAKWTQKVLNRSSFFQKHFDVVHRLWNEHTWATMFFGKLAYGMALPFLISAGMVKMPYKKFITRAIPITLFQYGTLMFIGYSSGGLYTAAIKYVHAAYYILAILVLIIATIYFFVSKYAKRKMIALEKESINKS